MTLEEPWNEYVLRSNAMKITAILFNRKVPVKATTMSVYFWKKYITTD